MAWWVSFGDESHLGQLEELAVSQGSSGWTCAKGLRRADGVIFYLKKPIQAFVAQGVALEDSSPPTGADDGTWEAKHWMASIGDIRMLPRRHTRQEMKSLLPDWGWLRAPRRETRVPDHLVEKILDAINADVAGHREDDLELWLPEVEVSKLLAAEGRLRWRTHLTRERSPRLTADKRRFVLAEKGRLACEACNFNFGKVYGPQCENFCEVHHNKPLASGQGTRVTLIDDLAILCPNCHRAIHRIDPMPTVEALTRKSHRPYSNRLPSLA